MPSKIQGLPYAGLAQTVHKHTYIPSLSPPICCSAGLSELQEGKLVDHVPFSRHVTLLAPTRVVPDGQSNLAMESHMYSTMTPVCTARPNGVGQSIAGHRMVGGARGKGRVASVYVKKRMDGEEGVEKTGREGTGVRVRGMGKCGMRYVTYKLCTIVCKHSM